MKRISACILATIAMCLMATSAFSHMGVEPPYAVAGSRTIVTLRVSHDCGDETVGTTNFTILLPPRLPSVKVEQMPHWRVFMHKVNETVDGEVMEYVNKITYIGFLPDGFYQLFNVRIKMPETPGTALWFRGYQDCHNQGTSLAWDMIPTPENPKPRYPAGNVTLVTEEEFAAM